LLFPLALWRFDDNSLRLVNFSPSFPMANIKSVEKRARQSVRRHARNTSVLTSLKTAQKRARKAIAAGDATIAQTEIDRLSSALDKAAKRGIIHSNAANRGKSRIQRARAKASAPAAA